jgi:hypothetical protein
LGNDLHPSQKGSGIKPGTVQPVAQTQRLFRLRSPQTTPAEAIGALVGHAEFSWWSVLEQTDAEGDDEDRQCQR